MNQFVPDWSNMGDTSRPLGEDDDLIELLWCNGHVVMQSQTHRKVPARPEKAAGVAPAAPLALADSLDKDILSEFFCDAPTPAPAGAAAAQPVASGGTGKPRRDVPVEADGACAVSEDPCDLMPPPKSTTVSCSRPQATSLANGGDNTSDLVRAGSAGKAAAEAGTSSTPSAIGSSICGSNQVLVQRVVSAPGRASASASASGSGSGTARGGSGSALPSAMGSANANAAGGGGRGTEASSSGRSNHCFGTTTTEPTSTSDRSRKRKRLDTEDSESPGEDAESESAATLARKKPPQKMTTPRSSRAAEVHNLSERVRERQERAHVESRAMQASILP